MNVYHDLNFHTDLSAVSLGKFDGIHAGHRELLKRITSKPGLVPSVFTFEINNEDGRKYIYSQAEKDILLNEAGIKNEIIIKFDDIRKMPPERFIKDVLCGCMDARYISVGEDFRFGYERSGDTETLKKYAGKYGYEVDVVKKSSISSTLVRSLIMKGKIEEASQFLGHPYFFEGNVVHGEHMGNKIGFPTANLNIGRNRLLPPSGAYASETLKDGKAYPSITNIGNKPTAGNFDINIETHILDFDEDIYGKDIEVRILKFMRPEKKFDSFDELGAQLEKDKYERRVM